MSFPKPPSKHKTIRKRVNVQDSANCRDGKSKDCFGEIGLITFVFHDEKVKKVERWEEEEEDVGLIHGV